MATVEMERATLMKAAVRRVYGEADVVHVEQVGRPSIARNEVLVRVHAAGVDRGVWHLMTGLPYLFRTAGIGVRTPKDPSLGMDLAGVVEAVGGDVTKFRPGDEVFGVGAGSFAEYARARADRLAIKPANLTFEEAAAVAVSASTALLAVRDHGHVQSGQEVLVIGASGGVGSYAVQIAKAFGARVTGVCSPSKLELVRLLGADAVIDYTQVSGEDLAAAVREANAGQGMSAVYDGVGKDTFDASLASLITRGMLVLYGASSGPVPPLDPQRLNRGGSLYLTRPTLRHYLRTRDEFLWRAEEVLGSLADGTLRVEIGGRYPLDEAARAYEDLENRRTTGKLLLTR